MSLLKYTIRRVLALIPILLGVLFMAFALTRQMPGDPWLLRVGEHMTDSQRAWYEAQVNAAGIDRPIIEQFFRYLGNLFQGEWGESISMIRGKPVWDLILERFPRTIEIALLAMLFSTFLGIRAGITSAVHRNKRKDTVIRFFALIGVAIPVFWLGMMCQYLFSYKIKDWFGDDFRLPATLYYSPRYGSFKPDITGLRLLDSLLMGEWLVFKDTVLHLVLPVFCLGFISLAGITRQTRSSMLEVLELDFIRTARAKGCSEKDVINKHAWRNAMIPTITIVGLGFAGLLGGAVLTETTFNLGGMGTLTLQAINAIDYYVINACVFMMTIIFVIANLITDLLYGIVDPRIRY